MRLTHMPIPMVVWYHHTGTSYNYNIDTCSCNFYESLSRYFHRLVSNKRKIDLSLEFDITHMSTGL